MTDRATPLLIYHEEVTIDWSTFQQAGSPWARRVKGNALVFAARLEEELHRETPLRRPPTPPIGVETTWGQEVVRHP